MKPLDGYLTKSRYLDGHWAMENLVRFRSSQFPSYKTEVEGPNFENGVYGKRIAEYLCGKLPLYGFQVADCFAEDWGWMVCIKHDRKYPLFIGCGHSQESEDSFLCFIEPNRPVIRKWFRKIDVREDVSTLKDALIKILKSDPLIHTVEWSED
jgi:hypothetical protein